MGAVRREEVEPAAASEGVLWDRLDALLGTIVSRDGPMGETRAVEDLVEHRVHLLAARSWRRRGRAVPEALVRAEQRGALVTLAAHHILRLVAQATAHRFVLMKGPEVAAWYPDPLLRSFGDVDLLVEDAAAVQTDLLRHGFVEHGPPELYRDIHHLRPVAWPGLPLVVEVHSRPKWPLRLREPEVGGLVGGAVPSATGLSGVWALPPACHAVVIAAHSWAHEPLRRLGELVDVAALVDDPADRAEATRVAASLGLERVWRATLSAVDAVLLGREAPCGRARVLARHLGGARGRTVLESHVAQWMGPFSALPPRRALRAAADAVAADLSRDAAEPWARKLRRAQLAVSNANRPRADHERMLERRDA